VTLVEVSSDILSLVAAFVAGYTVGHWKD